MFNFSPFNWASSMFLSKFLSPYFISIDNKQVDVGFWDGSLVLRNLQLKENIFLQHDIDLQILSSFVAELKITIPWKNLKQKAIKVNLSGVKLVLSNLVTYTENKKHILHQHMQELKIEALKKFDEQVIRQEKGGPQSSEDEKGGFFADLFEKLLENFILEINDLEIVYVYHLNKYEIVKLGFSLGYLKLSSVHQVDKMKKENLPTGDNLMKDIVVKDLSVIFEFYDNFTIISKISDDLNDQKFIDNLDHKTEMFLRQFHQDNKALKLDEATDTEEQSNDLKRFYILRKMDLFILIQIKLAPALEIAVNIRTNPIIIFLKQRQLRLLVRALKNLLNHRHDRPKLRPGQSNGARFWWRYIISRVAQENCISGKAIQQQLASFLGAERYRFIYTKKMLKCSRLKKTDMDFILNFEKKSSLAQVLILRTSAINKIIQMRDSIQQTQGVKVSEQKQAKSWFSQFDEDFDQVKASNLRFNSKFVKQNMQGLSEQDREAGRSQSSFSVVMVISQCSILIQENEMLQQFKNLHHQVNLFKQELDNKKQLRDQVLEHIKTNFLDKLNQQQQGKKNRQPQQENFTQSEWSVQRFLKSKQKLLIHLEINSINLEFNTQGLTRKLIKGSLESVLLNDPNKLNIHYQKILDLPQGLRIMVSSEIVEHDRRYGDHLEHIEQVYVDADVGPVNITISKPLFERIKSLCSLVFFDPTQYDKQPNIPNEGIDSQSSRSLYFEQILIQQRRKQKQVNMNLKVKHINIYLPLMYHHQSDMLLIHLKTLRFFKREHQNNLVAMYTMKSEIGTPHQIQVDVDGIQKIKKIHKITNQSLINNSNEDCLQPLFISLECMRVAFVKEYSWEEQENFFLTEYKRIQGDKSLQKNILVSGSIETILETLPIHIRMDSTVERIEIGEIDEKKHDFRRYILPLIKKTEVQLPFLNINLSIKHMYQLQHLGATVYNQIFMFEQWSTKGYDLFDVIQNSSTTGSGQQEYLKQWSNTTSSMKMPIIQKKAIPRQLVLTDSMADFLQDKILNQIQVRMEGMNFQLLVNTQEKVQQWKNYCEDRFDDRVPVNERSPLEKPLGNADQQGGSQFVRTQMYHENRLLQLYFEQLLYNVDQSFYQTVQNVGIQQLVLRDFSCHKFDLRAPLKLLGVNMLNHNDYSLELQKAKESMQNVNSRQGSRAETNHFQAEKKNIISREEDVFNKFGEELIKAIDGLSDISQSIPVDRGPLITPICTPSQRRSTNKLLELSDSILTGPNTDDVIRDVFEFEPFIRDFWLFNDPQIHCSQCSNPQQKHLILNFMKPPPSVSQLDFYMQQVKRVGAASLESPKSQINLEMQSLNFIMDPIMVAQIKMVIDVGSMTADLQRQQFELWMKKKGFWPDFNEQPQQSQSVPQTEEKCSIVKSRVIMQFRTISILCAHESEIIFLLSLKSIGTVISTSDRETLVQVEGTSVQLFDTSKNSGNHPQILTDNKDENNLNLEIRVIADENLIKQQNHNTYCGIRLRDIKLVFLKRNTNEIVYYIRKIAVASFYSKLNQGDSIYMQKLQIMSLLKSIDPIKQIELYADEMKKKNQFDKEIEQQLKNQQALDNSPSKFRFSLCVLDSYAIGYRNSISYDGLFLNFSKVGFWFTGQWGMDYDQLIKTGLFSEELEAFQANQQQHKQSCMHERESVPQPNFFSDDVQDEFALFDAQQPPKDRAETQTFFTAAQESEDQQTVFESCQMVMIWDLEIRTCLGNAPETMFLKCPGGVPSLELKIIWEDLLFKKLYPENTTNPMRINVTLPEAKLYAYDLDYCTLCKFFQENLGEQAQTVINPAFWDVNNSNIWMMLDINLGCAIAKFFKGKRSDISEYIKANNLNIKIEQMSRGKKGRSIKNERARYFLYKNPASVCFAKLKRVNFKFMMRESGGKLMKLIVEKINLADFREGSLLHTNKWVLFREEKDQFRGEDENISEANIEYDLESKNENWSHLDSDEEYETQKKQNIQQKTANPIYQKPNQSPNPPNSSISQHVQWQDENEKQENEKQENEKQQINKQQIESILKQSNEKNINISNSKEKYIINHQERLVDLDLVEDADIQSLKPKISLWQNLKDCCNRVFCCKRRKSITQQIKKAESQQIQLNEGLFIGNSNSISQNNNFFEPQKVFPNRHWRNYRENQALPITIVDDPEDYDNLQNEDDGKMSDFKLIMRSGPDGEKLIKMVVENKNLLILVDFLVDVVQYFRTPFNGSDTQPYQRMPLFNNYPPMVVQVKVNNLWAIILGDYSNVNTHSLALLVDITYQQQWAGDNWIGPGRCEKKLDLKLKKTYIFKTDHIVKQKKNLDMTPFDESDDISPVFSTNQTKVVKFKNIYNGNSAPQYRSLLEPFQVLLVTTYSLDFWRKAVPHLFVDGKIINEIYMQSEDQKQTQGQMIYPYYADVLHKIKQESDFTSHNHLSIKLINNTRLKNNFSISIRDVAQVQKILSNVSLPTVVKRPTSSYVMNRLDPPNYDFEDHCVSTKKISVGFLRIQILKNKDGVKVGNLEVSNLLMKDLTRESRSELVLCAKIQINYFNKRRLAYEPFLENWKFRLKVDKSDEVTSELQRNIRKVKLTNYIENDLDKEIPYYLKDHTNSLNLNISTALLETGMEAQRIFCQEMDDGEPYRIFNRCGYPIELRDIKRDAQLHRILENGDIEWKGWRDIYFHEGGRRSQREGGQQMLLNLLVLKKEVVNEEYVEDDRVDEDPQIPIKVNLSGEIGPVIQGSPSPIIMNKNNRDKRGGTFMAQSTQPIISSVGVKKQTQKQLTFKKFNRNEISNFKLIKYVSLDHVGKRLYPIEKIYHNDLNEGQRQKKGTTFDLIEKKIEGLLKNTRKVNEEGNTYLMVNVLINPQNGSKEIRISSAVKFFNYLDAPIEVGFLANGQNKETLVMAVGPRQLYSVPLDFLQNKTQVRFVPYHRQKRERLLMREYDSEYKYYQLDNLICDGAARSEFEVDTQSTVSEVLSHAESYASSSGHRESLANEFKNLIDPLIYKVDHQIYTTNNQGRTQQNKFYFVMSCVKVKHRATNQRQAYLQYTGLQGKSYDNNLNEESEAEVCYETFLIFYPVFKITNASIRRLNLYYGIQSNSDNSPNENQLEKTRVYPGNSFMCNKMEYSEDILLKLKLESFEKTSSVEIFQMSWIMFNEKRCKFEVIFKKKKQNNKKLYLIAVLTKLSQKTREIVIYCPYLIMNDSGKGLMYREYGLTQDIVSVDVEKKGKKNNRKPNNFKDTKIIDPNEQQQSEQYDEPIEDDVFVIDNERFLLELKMLHMFSTSTNMKRIQIALKGFESAGKQQLPSTNWSKPVSLQNNDGVLEVIGSTEVFKHNIDDNHQINRAKTMSRHNPVQQSVDTSVRHERSQIAAATKGKYEFGMRIITAPGIFHRSKLIIISPRYIIHNETPYCVAVAQAETEQMEDNLHRLKSGEQKCFFWSDVKKKEHVVVSFYEQGTGVICGWSGLFRISNVCEMSLKIKNPPRIHSSNSTENMDNLYSLQKVNISLIDDNIHLIRFIHEDPIIPPYYIENLTKYEISFRQKYLNFQNKRVVAPDEEVQGNMGIHYIMEQQLQFIPSIYNYKPRMISVAAGGNELTFLQPGERVAFTWDHYIDEFEHILEVEIEGINQPYHIDKIQDFSPIVLPSNLRRKINKDFLYKQGKIHMKEYDKFNAQYCVLNVLKQKLQIYSLNKTNREVYSLKGAKLDETKDKEFMICIDSKRLTARTLYFQSESLEEHQLWIDFFWRAILINKPDMVELKIEPMNSTKVLSFFIMRQVEDQSIQKKLSKLNVPNISGISTILKQQVDDDDPIYRTNFQKFMIQTYQISISNCIGLSLVDDHPREIIQICIKNLQLTYTTSDEQVKDESNTFLADHNEEEEEKENRSGFSQSSIVAEKSYLRVIKDYLNVTIELVVINNQLLNAQFPVLLAPNKKKIYGEQQPFLMVSLFWKDQNKEINLKKAAQTINSQATPPKISYIHTCTVFTDTLEIRLDDNILEAILNFISQLQVLLIDGSEVADTNFDFRSLQAKIEEKLISLKLQNTSQKYIKNLMLEPIDICFTFRSSPGHTLNVTTKNYITDLGLTLASIDSAKIKLNALKTQHIFGSSNEISSRIGKHYSRQFLSQIYKLFGAFELFGNPVSLIENLGTGVIDMFYEPLYALVKGQSAHKVGEKFVSGAMSLIVRSIQGVYKTVNNILGSIMKLLANMTFDKSYIQQRQNRLNRTIKNFKEGLIIGFKNFASIILETVIGIIKRPIIEANLRGILGLFLGLYQGIMGIIIKPTVGIFDLLTTIIEGIKNTAVYEERIMDTRFRPPRIFGENQLLINFDFIPAIGTDIIRKYKLKPIEMESILFFDQIKFNPNNKKSLEAQIVLTDMRLVYIMTHSSIQFDKIMIYKIKMVSYLTEKRQMIFSFHTPIKRGFCRGESQSMQLNYESAAKATRLMREMENAFKEKYSIQFIYPEEQFQGQKKKVVMLL